MSGDVEIAVPRTVEERIAILAQARRDAAYRARVLDQCAASCVFFCNLLIWGVDPRPGAAAIEMPFFLFPFQEALLAKLDAALVEQDDLLIEKSRDMGGTFVVLIWALHGWLFRAGWHGLLGSRKQDFVDDRTIDSHFGKIDFFLSKMPGWFMAEVVPGFQPRRHRQKLKLVNPNRQQPALRGNTLKGESSNEEFGRAGRQTFIFFDEASKFRHFHLAWRAASQTTRTRVGLSTPAGMNFWGRLIHMDEVQAKRVTLHWRDHPWHDAAWYMRECKRLILPEDIAQELDINYRASVRGVVYPDWDSVKTAAIDYDPRLPLYVSWDAGLDMTALIWWQRDPVADTVTMLDCVQASNKRISWFVPFVTGLLPRDAAALASYTPEHLLKIAAHHGWGRAMHFGDPSLRQRDVGSGESPADVLRRDGIVVYTPNVLDHKTRRQKVLELLPRLTVNLPPVTAASAVNCWEADEAMRMARFQERDPDSQASGEPSPVHDATSHYRTSVEWFALCLPPVARSTRPAPLQTRMIFDTL
ncbi:MAG: hypothetical protein IT340_20055 [Chloroflexi bacterium]|nr:hypothetical protein [Chloroflexota bacterium]